MWFLLNVFGNLFATGPLASRILSYIEPRAATVLQLCITEATRVLHGRVTRLVGILLVKLVAIGCVAGPIILGTPSRSGPWGSIIFALLVFLTVFSYREFIGFTFPRILALALAIDVTIPIVIAVQNVFPAFDTTYFVWFSLGLTMGIGSSSMSISPRDVARSLWAGVRIILPALVLLTVVAVTGMIIHGKTFGSPLLPGTIAGLIIMIGFFLWADIITGHYLIRRGLVELTLLRPYLRVMQWPAIGFVLGYILIVVWFAGLFSSIYHVHPAQSFAITNDPSTHMSWSMFLYFSFMTISTLGYGDIHPTSALTQTLTSLEVLIGIAWTIIVFAAVVAYVGPRIATIATLERDGKG